MFWLGFGIGAVIGGIVGIIAISCCVVAGKYDDENKF